MDILPTVKICNPADQGGYIIINKSDFVEGEHTLWISPEEAEAAAKAEAEARARAEAEATAKAEAEAEAKAKTGKKAEA